MINSSSESRLPPQYREVAWLKGTGSQYCVTNIFPVNNGTNFTSIKGDITILDKETSIFQIASTWTQNNYIHNYSVLNHRAKRLPSQEYGYFFVFRYGKNNTAVNSIDITDEVYPLDVHYELNINNVIINGTSYSKGYFENYSATRPLIIGGDNTSSGAAIYNNETLVKPFEIYNKNTLLYTFVPCYRKTDHKTGFCKINVQDESVVFLENAGESEWVIGPTV